MKDVTPNSAGARAAGVPEASAEPSRETKLVELGERGKEVPLIVYAGYVGAIGAGTMIGSMGAGIVGTLIVNQIIR